MENGDNLKSLVALNAENIENIKRAAAGLEDVEPEKGPSEGEHENQKNKEDETPESSSKVPKHRYGLFSFIRMHYLCLSTHRNSYKS